MPKATVVVPVYNVEKYLQKCVDSILAQTEPDFELLLLDDGSETVIEEKEASYFKLCDDEDLF